MPLNEDTYNSLCKERSAPSIDERVLANALNVKPHPYVDQIDGQWVRREIAQALRNAANQERLIGG